MPAPVRVAAVMGVLALAGSPAAGQPAAAEPPTGARLSLLSAYRFHLAATSFASDDPRFDWDADLGGDVDLLDYGVGRLNFLANYEAILGSEFQRFDPNQGNYTLDVTASARLGRTEVAAVFHHVSRHLGDRAKAFPIDWNMWGVRVSRRAQAGRLRVEGSARALLGTKRSFVDYTSEAGGRLAFRYDLRAGLALVTRIEGLVVGVDDAAGRGAQAGGLGEVGLRVTGRGAAVELFVAVERRIDADPLERLAHSWAQAGFRLTNR